MQPATMTIVREVPLATYTDREQVTCPEDAFAVLQPVMTGLDRETCLVVSLDIRHRVLAVDTVSIGTSGQTFMSPREIFRTALMRSASAIFVAHNHPSGDPHPSTDDRVVSRRLHEAGQMIGVDLIDHLIIGDSTFVSLARTGIL